MARIKVCVVLEGSYPYITGGVSAWLHDLITGLSEIDFLLLTISPEDNQPLRYTLPGNVIYHKDIILGSKIQKTPQIRDRLKRKTIKDILDSYAETNSITSSIARVIASSPLGYDPLVDFMRSDSGWNCIVEEYMRKNPLYPFSDFFWAWKSSYGLLFNIIAHELPIADIYHSVSTGFAGFLALMAKLRLKRPFLLTEHGLYHKEREMEIRRVDFVKGNQRDMWIEMYNELSEICYKNADLITSLFELNRQYQIDLGADPLKAIVTPNGIDIERFSINREEVDGFHVGLVGRVVPIKDIKTYIKTCRLLVDKIPNVKFYCIGPTDEDPHYYLECQKLVKSLKLEESFEFTGRVNVLEYYKFLNVLLLTSVREAQPLVILEAWLGGVPVVSTKVGNVPEMLDYDERLLASSKDSEKLADSVKFIYDNPERVEELKFRNINKVKNFYNKEKLLEQYKQLYTSLGG